MHACIKRKSNMNLYSWRWISRRNATVTASDRVCVLSIWYTMWDLQIHVRLNRIQWPAVWYHVRLMSSYHNKIEWRTRVSTMPGNEKLFLKGRLLVTSNVRNSFILYSKFKFHQEFTLGRSRTESFYLCVCLSEMVADDTNTHNMLLRTLLSNKSNVPSYKLLLFGFCRRCCCCCCMTAHFRLSNLIARRTRAISYSIK